MASELVEIDGAFGEGGGQIVRSAVALSCLTGRPIRVYNVRARRKNPGLGNQHVTAIRAARQICGARLEGVKVGSSTFEFWPGQVQPGNYSFDIGTAGSTTLVFQTIVWPLLSVEGDSVVTLVGGTHNPLAPCFDYLELVWAPFVRACGANVELSILRYGFYPVGGGRIRARIHGLGGLHRLRPLVVEARDEKGVIRLWSRVARLPESIAARQRNRAVKQLERAGYEVSEAEEGVVEAMCPGTYVFLHYEDSFTRAGFQALGERGKRAERVADEAVAAFLAYVESDAALDPHMADQIVFPLAFARGSSSYTTSEVTQHLLTHVHLLRLFLDRAIEVDGELGRPGRVTIAPAEADG